MRNTVESGGYGFYHGESQKVSKSKNLNKLMGKIPTVQASSGQNSYRGKNKNHQLYNQQSALQKQKAHHLQSFQ